ESPEDPMDGNDTDNDVFRSGSESPQFTLPVIADPKQRRATVSGGSPTFERSSLVADDLDLNATKGHGHGGLGHGHSLDPPPTQQRPRSQAINAQEKEAAIAALLAAGDVGAGFSMLPSKKDEGKTAVSKEKRSISDSEETSRTTAVSNNSGNNSNSQDTDATPQCNKDSDLSAEKISTEAQKTFDTEGESVKEESGFNLEESVSRSDARTPSQADFKMAQEFDEVQPVVEGAAKEMDQEQASNTNASARETSANGKPSPQPVNTATPEKEDEKNTVQDFTIQKPTPVLRQNAVGSMDMSSGKNWTKSKIINTEVASNASRGDLPRLQRIRRLDSREASDMEPKIEDDDVFDKPQKKVGFADDTQSSSKDQPESYTHIVVGGVVQKIPVEKAKVPSSASESPPVKMRNKTGSKTKLDRRVSCKDLGRGDCEGWLYKRKQKDRTLSKHWDKRWCVLKNQVLYYYKQKDALKAEGLIHLPAFQVSPATNLKTKKFAFKIHNAGTTFYFASERQEDMSKWMNKLGLAAIKFDIESRNVAMGGFNRPEKLSSSSSAASTRIADYSESEDEMEEPQLRDKDKWQGSAMSLASMSSLGSSSGSLANSSPLVKRHRLKDVQETEGTSTEELHTLLRSIQKNDLTIDGKDKVRQRQSQCTATSDLKDLPNQADIERLKKLHSLQRTLRDKELQLELMEDLMKNPAAIRDVQDFIDLSGLQSKSTIKTPDKSS
ncbi:connector enhancer of kinase suppressor of ras 2, partial [Plakobranchus ocellatus]